MDVIEVFDAWIDRTMAGLRRGDTQRDYQLVG